MKGRKPNLTVLHSKPPPKKKCPTPPTWLTKHAKSEWRRVAPELHDRHLLHKDTLATLENYCIAVGQVRESEITMQEDGRHYVTEKGTIAVHPAFKIQAQAMREARLLAAELGLTPHRRVKSDGGKKSKPKSSGWDDELLA